MTTAKLQQMQKDQAQHLEIFEFQNGIPGFPDYKKFFLRKLKDGFYDPLHVLVSLDNPAMSFILYPHYNGYSLLQEEETAEITTLSGHEKRHINVYSIVNVQEPNGHLHLTTNLKAPIILDHKHHKGWQHILSAQDKPLHFVLKDLSQQLQMKRKKN
jgi:Uncharacterized protein conserved in bacteria